MPTAIVTGSSRGIGRGIAISLAEAGHDVLINYTRNEDAAREVADEVMSRGARAEIHRANVGEIEEGRALVDRAIESFGRLDLLVNNAGIAPRVRADLLEAGTESYDDVMGTNLRGPYFLTQYAANQMIKLLESGTIEMGRIVVISSISAFTTWASHRDSFGDHCRLCCRCGQLATTSSAWSSSCIMKSSQPLSANAVLTSVWVLVSVIS